MSLRALIENEYKPWLIAHRKSSGETFLRISRCFFPSFGDKFLCDLTIHDFEKWCTQKLNLGRKEATINRDIDAIRAAMSKAVLWGFIEKNPLSQLKAIKFDNSPKVRYLDKEEEKRLRESLDKREEKLKTGRHNANQWRKERHYELLTDLHEMPFADYLKPMVLLSINTGLRQGELFSLTWEHVNLGIMKKRAWFF